MKKLFLILLILSSCGTGNKKNNPIEGIFTLDFQSNFSKDSTTLFINDCLIFENVILESDKIDGVTNMSIELKQHKNSGVIVDINGKEQITCKGAVKPLRLKIIVNQVVNNLYLDLERGKYIGFDKTFENKLKLNQSYYPFEYD
ncbi:MAG TPA: hypothetical protein VIM94_10900 [Salegentibacter sp.]|uniref:hypothetical protein n=1 Tax=Salegentibacter sp. TaxID=1903072 RepID=UPI002F9301DC